MTPLEMNRFLAEKVMGWQLQKDFQFWYVLKDGSCHTPVHTWNPIKNWNQCIMCQEVVMRERPKVYYDELYDVINLPPRWDTTSKDVCLAFASATQEQRVKAMVRCYE